MLAIGFVERVGSIADDKMNLQLAGRFFYYRPEISNRVVERERADFCRIQSEPQMLSCSFQRSCEPLRDRAAQAGTCKRRDEIRDGCKGVRQLGDCIQDAKNAIVALTQCPASRHAVDYDNMIQSGKFSDARRFQRHFPSEAVSPNGSDRWL